MKRCTSCHEMKSLEFFRERTDRKKKKDGGFIISSKCLICERKTNLERYHNLPEEIKISRRKRNKEVLGKEYFRKYKLMNNYGISLDVFNRMYMDQGGQCYICNTSFNDTKPNIDHDHQTKKIRKLLCGKCNMVLGLLKEDVNLFNKCISYLEDHASIH